MRSTRTLPLALALAALALFAPQAMAVSGSITVNPATGKGTAVVSSAGGSMSYVELSMPDASGQGTSTTYTVSGVQQPCNGTEAVSYGISCTFSPSGGPTSITIPFTVSPVPPSGSVSLVKVGLNGPFEQGILTWNHTGSTAPPRSERLTDEEKEALKKKIEADAREAADFCHYSPVGQIYNFTRDDPSLQQEFRQTFDRIRAPEASKKVSEKRMLNELEATCLAMLLKNVQQKLAELRDPPDSRYGEIALPASPRRDSTRRACRKRTRRTARGCQTLDRSVDRAAELATAVDHTADVLGALLIAIDRFETAQRDGNVDGQMLQGAVFATLAGMLAEAERAEDAAENRFAAELRRLGIRHEASSRGTQRIQRNLAAMRGIPASVTRPLRTRGYSKAELRDLFRTTFGGKAFRPVKSESLLRRKTDISAFEADHRSIRLVEIRAIVSSFAASGAFNAEQAATLRADLDAADAAATPQDRAAAVGTLIEHASAFRGAASQFLRFAAGPLASA